MGEDHVWLQGDQFFCQWLIPVWAGCKTIVDTDVTALRPSAPFQPLPESAEARLRLRVVLGQADEHTNPPDLIGLRARYQWPCHRRAAKKCNELAPPHISPGYERQGIVLVKTSRLEEATDVRFG